jgi:hypothetical protein
MMHREWATDLWRWPIAVVPSLVSLFLAALAAWVAYSALNAIPRWAMPWVSLGAPGSRLLGLGLRSCPSWPARREG